MAALPTVRPGHVHAKWYHLSVCVGTIYPVGNTSEDWPLRTGDLMDRGDELKTGTL